MPTDWSKQVNSYNAFYVNDDSAPLGDNGYPEDLYLPLIGNGYISQAKGVRSDSMFVSGIFNNATTSPSHRARIPAMYAASISNVLQPLGALIDVQKGIYSRRGTLEGNASYEMRWYAHRTKRSLFILEIDILPSPNTDSPVTLSVENIVFFESEDFSFKSTEPIPDAGPGAVYICGVTTISETPEDSTHEVCIAMDSLPSTLSSNASSDTKLAFIAAIRTSLDVSSNETPASAAIGDYTEGRLMFESGSLLTSHCAGWSALWESGIEVSGRPDIAAAVNSSLFAILSSVRDDWAFGLAPGGLTNYYNGHSFWDTETWMYPALLFLYPDIARSLLQYRFDRIEGARTKASSYSPPWAGAMYPWESAFSGQETCPTVAETGLREHHISGDISLAVWQEW
jgi:hypothetical protein